MLSSGKIRMEKSRPLFSPVKSVEMWFGIIHRICSLRAGLVYTITGGTKTPILHRTGAGVGTSQPSWTFVVCGWFPRHWQGGLRVDL